MNTNLLIRNHSSGGLMPNKRFADMAHSKSLEIDFEDRVACNCSLLEIFPVHELSINLGGLSQTAKDTIFMGTYDGILYSMRMVIKEEGVIGTENITSYTYALVNLKKWNFSGPILTMINFGVNVAPDTK